MAVMRVEAGAPLAERLLLSLESADLGKTARSIVDAAVMLMDACDSGRFAAALEANMKVWVALKTVAASTPAISPELRDRLARLADYVSARTMAVGDGKLDGELIASLAGINLQIAGGFIDSVRQEAVRLRAREIWTEQGSPDGRDLEHWYQAERELFAS